VGVGTGRGERKFQINSKSGARSKFRRRRCKSRDGRRNRSKGRSMVWRRRGIWQRQEHRWEKEQ